MGKEGAAARSKWATIRKTPRPSKTSSCSPRSRSTTPSPNLAWLAMVMMVTMVVVLKAKTVKVLNGDLYIDYKYIGPVPDNCRI